jgi:flagellar hook assembly protein FlgD
VRYDLQANHPNPFNPATHIRFDVPEGGGAVKLRIYDVEGRLVRTLVDGYQSAGRKTATWHGRNNQGQIVSSGVCFYRMTAAGFEMTRKMVL